MMNDCPYPADAFASSQIRSPICFNIAFLNDMPESPLPVLMHGMAAQANPHSSIKRRVIDQIGFELCINGGGVCIPASAMIAKLGVWAEPARELCYRFYTLCERKKRAQEALAYNALVQSWPELARLAREVPEVKVMKQGELL